MEHEWTKEGLTGFPPLPQGFFRRNRQRLLDLLKKSAKFEANGILFLSGPTYLNRYDDDSAERIIFEPFFYYLFGIKDDVDTFGVIEIDTGKAIVFTQKPDPLQMTVRRFRKLDEFKAAYEIDDAKYTADLEAYLNSRGGPQDYPIYLNFGRSPVSKLPVATPEEAFKGILSTRKVDKDKLYAYGREARLFKSDEEVQILRYCIQVAGFAHRAAMRRIAPGMTEKELSDQFTALNRFYDSDTPYSNIFCAGENGAYLHYIPSPTVTFQNGQLCLNDSGGKVYGYNSDITRTFPVNGKFSPKQRDIYNLVLLAQTEALKLTKPGVQWVETHKAAYRTIFDGLQRLGLIIGAVSEDELKMKLAHCFMPHGLGHYIGLYVHDLPGLEELRGDASAGGLAHPVASINRILAKGMVITVEPGIYFNKVLLEQSYNDPALKPYLNQQRIEEYAKEVGGVRIEDMYLITDAGYDDLSKGLIKSADEIESFMRG